MLLGLSTGCETQSWFDPSEMGRYNHTPLLVPILKNLDTGIAEGGERFTQATEIRQSDLTEANEDYRVGANDLLQVSITDLVGPGIETVKAMRVSESGYISLPLVGQVKASGYTEAQLEDAVSAAYRDKNLIRDATVSVVTIEARNRTFSIYGAVNQVGQYQIVDSDFRLRNAMVLARDFTSPLGIDYIYVFRQIDQDKGVEGGQPVPSAPANPLPSPDVLTPRSQAPTSIEPKMLAQQPTPPASGAEGRIIQVEGQQLQIQGGQPAPAGTTQTAPAVSAIDQPVPATGQPFEFNDLEMPNNERIIRIPVEPFKTGDPRYNIAIRPQDFIWVPQPIVGEYYMGGHVLRTGVYSLTARDITLRSAVIAAGGLDQLAMPHRTEIVRKIDRFKKVYVRVDLSKVMNGQEPDILLKPDDEIMVGTNAIAPFLAAFRSAFRLTYGAGFIYDRNFSDGQGGISF